MMQPLDLFYWIDAFVLIYVYKKFVSKNRDERIFKKDGRLRQLPPRSLSSPLT